jgi:hypothetical protein
MRIRVPEEQSRAFRDLIAMSTAERKALLEAVAAAEPTLMITELAGQVAAALNKESSVLLGQLAVLTGLFMTRVRSGEPVGQFVDDVCAAGQQLLAATKDERPVEWESFRADLSTALQMENPIGVTAKAIDVTLAHQRVFAEARILTDVRPIFYLDPSEKPNAAVVAHTLQISYYENGEAKDYFVAMDAEDLAALGRALDRAGAKEATIRGWLKQCGVTWLNPEEAEHESDVD